MAVGTIGAHLRKWEGLGVLIALLVLKSAPPLVVIISKKKNQILSLCGVVNIFAKVENKIILLYRLSIKFKNMMFYK